MYTFKNTEINNKKCSDFETKSLLYLFGIHKDNDEISLIAVDCFNDVTGANTDFSKLWDVQSKNHSSLPPSKIGESLSTLYDNFISTISFHDYILFIPKLKREYLVDGKLSVYSYGNINTKQQKGIERKLKEKINGDSSGKTPPLFSDFLNKVNFVEDNKRVSTYIKKLSKFKSKKTIPEHIYEGIFKEIRNAQASLKNSYIENEKIKTASEVIKFNRHITKSEINTLLISRLIGVDDVFSFPGVPTSFLIYISGMEEEDVKDLLQECNENLSRAFFDKNGCKEFWSISEKVIGILKSNPKHTVENTYEQITNYTTIKSSYLTEITVKYMISLVKTGLDHAS